MSLFWIFATALLLAVFVLAFVPLSRVKENGARWTMLAIVLIVPLAAILLYQTFVSSSPKSLADHQRKSGQGYDFRVCKACGLPEGVETFNLKNANVLVCGECGFHYIDSLDATVDPVPTPSVVPGSIKASAASAALRFFSNASISVSYFPYTYIGVAVIGLIGFYFVMTSSAQAEAAKLSKSLFNPKTGKLPMLVAAMPVPGDPDIKHWGDYREAMTTGYIMITGEFSKKDESLEAWFPALIDKDRSSFMARYRDEISSLETALTEKGVNVGIPVDVDDPSMGKKYGFNWEDPQESWDKLQKGEEPVVIKNLQKRFLIRKRVADIVLTSGAKVSSIHDFRFFKPQNLWLGALPEQVRRREVRSR